MTYLLLLQSRDVVRAQDFAKRFEVSERTVYRDIQALCEVGVPISAMPGEGYRLMEGYYLPPIAFTSDEARAIFLAISMLDGFTEAGKTKTAVLTVLEKVRAILPKTTLQQLEALKAILHFYAFPAPLLSFDDPLFLRLQEAIHQRLVVQLQYHALNTPEATGREVEPLQLVFLDKTWMLTAYCRLRRDVRTFRLDRIDELVVCKEQFTPRQIEVKGREPGTLTVVVQFKNEVVRWVRERQHFTFERQETTESGTHMIYRPRSFDQIEGWLLSWGDKMTVLEPLELRQQIHKTAESILTAHKEGESC